MGASVAKMRFLVCGFFAADLFSGRYLHGLVNNPVTHLNKWRKLLIELRFSSLDKGKHIARQTEAFPVSLVPWVETLKFSGILLFFLVVL